MKIMYGKLNPINLFKPTLHYSILDQIKKSAKHQIQKPFQNIENNHASFEIFWVQIEQKSNEQLLL